MGVCGVFFVGGVFHNLTIKQNKKSNHSAQNGHNTYSFGKQSYTDYPILKVYLSLIYKFLVNFMSCGQHLAIFAIL